MTDQQAAELKGAIEQVGKVIAAAIGGVEQAIEKVATAIVGKPPSSKRGAKP